MENKKYWIWLSRIKDVRQNVLISLIEKYKNPEFIFKLSKKELIKENLNMQEINEILNKNYRVNIEKYINYMKDKKIDIITIEDKEYPYMLRNIYGYPILLYAIGNKNLLNQQSIAIVGCRDCSNYGKEIAMNLSYRIAKRNINIVSGLARGIDTFSHYGALNAKGKTIAVMGCGLNEIYPKENRNLFEKIIEKNGLILSEYIVGTRPIGKNFPKRNRIISGLSSGVVIVEARERSGAMITADFALEQGREVYAVPGNIKSVTSKGTNNLIKQGAKVVTSEYDIFEDIFY